MNTFIRFASLMMLSLLCCQKVQANCCCNPNIVDIYYVPFHIDGTINSSNTTYCVTQNLTYLGGEDEPAAAITVDPGVHDIVINFNGFELSLDPSVDGISMLGTAEQLISNVLIKDGIIKSITPSGTNNAINATNFNTVDVERMRFVDTRRGFATLSQTDTNTDLKFSSCVFDLKGVTGATRRGILISTIQGFVAEDCTFLANDPNEADLGIGILLRNNTKNAVIKRSTFDGQTTQAIGVQSIFWPEAGFDFTFASTNIIIDECEFTNNRHGDFVAIGTSNVQITNSTFFNSQFLAINFEGNLVDDFGNIITPVPSGLLVDNCTFTKTEGAFEDPFGPVVIFAGSIYKAGTSARDIIIRNSTLTHHTDLPICDGLHFSGVEGALIENCVFDFTGTSRDPNTCSLATVFGVPYKSAAIHLGFPLVTSDISDVADGSNVKDIIIRGNEICGGAQIGIYAETSIGTVPNERITIEDNSITANEVGILFENTHSSTILNNRVQGVIGTACVKGIGIELAGALSHNPTAASTSNAILNNVVSNNVIGILLRCGAQGNLVKGNFVFNNSDHQIKEEKKKTNVIEKNTIFLHCDKNLHCHANGG